MVANPPTAKEIEDYTGSRIALMPSDSRHITFVEDIPYADSPGKGKNNMLEIVRGGNRGEVTGGVLTSYMDNPAGEQAWLTATQTNEIMETLYNPKVSRKLKKGEQLQGNEYSIFEGRGLRHGRKWSYETMSYEVRTAVEGYRSPYGDAINPLEHSIRRLQERGVEFKPLGGDEKGAALPENLVAKSNEEQSAVEAIATAGRNMEAVTTTQAGRNELSPDALAAVREAGRAMRDNRAESTAEQPNTSQGAELARDTQIAATKHQEAQAAGADRQNERG